MDKNKRRRERYAKDPEHRKRVLERNKAWREKNRAKVLAIQKEWHKRNRQKQLKKMRERYHKKKKLHQSYYKTPKGKFSQYTSNAKRRKLKFGLTFEQFKELIEGNCVYCGNGNNNGIDRIDNSKGYVKGNVVTCCANCNWFKQEATQKEFAKRIVACLPWAKKYLNLE